MGTSIDLYIYKRKELLKNIKKWGADDEDLNIKILKRFGTFKQNKYLILNNENCDGNNPYFEVATVFEWAYKKEDFFDIICNTNCESGIAWVDIYEIADDLNIEMPEEFS